MKQTVRITWAFLLVMAGHLPVFAEGVLHPHFEMGTSVAFGDATELVFVPSDDRFYNDPLSRLTWPVPPSISMDLAVEWPWTDRTSTIVALRGLWPVTIGTLVDEDWKAATRNSSVFLNYGRSTHEGYLTGHWQARIEQTFKADDFVFGLGGEYRFATWEGWNGTGSYDKTTTSGTVSTRSTDSVTFSGLLIAYRQQWYIPYFAASWKWQSEGWSLTPAIRFSPYTWCFDMDNHNYATQATTTFLDNVRGGVYGWFGLEVAFGEEGELWGIRGSWESAYGAMGETTQTVAKESAATYDTTANSAGAWFQEASISVFMRN